VVVYGNHVTFELTNPFFQEFIKDHYEALLKEKFEAALGEKVVLHYKVVSPMEMGGGQRKANAKGAPPEDSPPEETEFYLNPKYSFESFVVGASNRFAHAASIAVAQNPGHAYNPLFIYGGVGLGKTHLMQAIGNAILLKNKRANVCYVSSETFTNELISAIQNQKTPAFRNRYRNVDALLIDDVQFLGGKDMTQEEFFHTFNTLYDAHKQIIMTSDRPPKEIPNMEGRLISRFEWGLVTDLQPPDMETRAAILRKKAELSGMKLPDEITFFLAEKIKTNIRKLEGCLIRVLSYSSLTGHELTLALTEEVLQDVLAGEEDVSITIETIQKKVAEHFDIRLADMTSKKRPKAIAYPRQIAMFLARQLTRYSLPEIGEAFGGRDHTTVMHACKLLESMIKKDYNIKSLITSLQNKIKH
jgi:chromosomal replication initiator protein